MLKTGKCINVPACPKALKREIQEADSLNFKCSHCGKDLIEVDGSPTEKGKDEEKGPKGPVSTRGPKKKTFMQKYGAMIGLGAGVLAIAGGVVAFLGGNGETLPPPPPPVEKIDVTDQVSLKKGEAEQLTMTVEPLGAEGTFVWKSSNEQVAVVDNQGQVTAVGKGKAQITVSLADNAAVSDVCACEVKDEPMTTKFSWGKYEGEMKNGKPHGTGKFVFTQKHVINSHDRKKRMANPGEYVQGQFVNGEITIGKHFAADGTLIQSLNFGTGL
ncbi:protein containing Bacterial Ig-like, group 2 domain protein [gut metagenome]|uniref:Protein containing Bacterial Ig-like, group 2 domain protein n=1 Tax=gut metagenome TaxID=749906 RepID=J9H1F9_9ZZZZ